MLQIHKDKKLFAKFGKCEFWLKSISLLSHIVTTKGISVDPKKTDAAKRFPRPLTPSGI